MITYAMMVAASQDASLTMSQKLNILFKDAKYETYEKSLRDLRQDEMSMVPSILQEKDAVLLAHDGDGQLLIFRLSDGTYCQIDTGSYTLDGSMFHLVALDDMDKDDQNSFWQSFLDEDFFYRGGFVDHDLQHSFATTFPDA